MSVVLPKRKRTTIVLSEIYKKTEIIDTIINALKFELGIDDEEFFQHDLFKSKLQQIKADRSVLVFENWYQYLFYVKQNLADIIRSIRSYSEYLSPAFLHEIFLLEKQLYSRCMFDGFKIFRSSSLSYAENVLQELLVHNKRLQEIKETEFREIRKLFDRDGRGYRDKHYNGAKLSKAE